MTTAMGITLAEAPIAAVAGLLSVPIAFRVDRVFDVIKIETQNVNVPACRFHACHGCELGATQRSAYPHLPEEVQLLWYKDLSLVEKSPIHP